MALPLLLLVILRGGGLLFVAVVGLVSGLGLWEFLGLLLPHSPAGRRWRTVALGALVVAGFALPPLGLAAASLWCPAVLVVSLFLLFSWHLGRYVQDGAILSDLAADALALLYLPFLLGHLVWLRFLPGGEWWVLWLLAVVFAGDTGAFYAGRTWGQRKLYPTVSPGKTWEGTGGGLAGSLLAGALAGKGLLPDVPLLLLMSLALGLALVGILGDLFESMLKRQAKVKDAGELLPGHGGMLDRLDSILFAGPLVVYVRLLLVGG